jgi:hypothetical protein
MFSLAISFGPQGQIWSLLFKEKQKPSEWQAAISNRTAPPVVVIDDDFGQSVSVVVESVHGVLMQDLDQMIESRIQHSLNDAKAQARYNARIKTDPEIRALQNGPAVLTPGFRN